MAVHCEQIIWQAGLVSGPANLVDAGLVLIFGSPEMLGDAALIRTVRESYPQAVFAGCSTAGEIHNSGIFENTLVSTAVRFGSTTVKIFYTKLKGADDSFNAGVRIANQIPAEHLRHLLLLSDGIHINGSELTRAFSQHLPETVTVTGGLAGDGDHFKRTYVLGESGAEEKLVSAVAFYGDNLQVGSGSLGGWDSFGPERIVSKSSGSVVYELDGKPILELYKTYLGDFAGALPASALLFPLSVRVSDAGAEYLVRTVLGIDEESMSMRFAGDIPEGARVRLMKANLNRLIDGAIGAAQYAKRKTENAGLALLISCVGRKLVLKQRCEEEIEAVRDIMGTQVTLTGFYSYGEISPLNGYMACSLHNQTMTITTYDEIG